jgi:bifunctional DNA-binding transcriptional regulator/antitoxin component of YhaV-PrlF toxin-antitoxin module
MEKEKFRMQTLLVEDIIKFQPKGVITIPKKLRKHAGLMDRVLVRAKAQKGKITLEPIYTTPYPIRTFSDEEINEWLELDKLESEELRKDDLLT